MNENKFSQIIKMFIRTRPRFYSITISKLLRRSFEKRNVSRKKSKFWKRINRCWRKTSRDCGCGFSPLFCSLSISLKRTLCKRISMKSMHALPSSNVNTTTSSGTTRCRNWVSPMCPWPTKSSMKTRASLSIIPVT